MYKQLFQKNKWVIAIIFLLLTYIFFTDIYKWEVDDLWQYSYVSQIWRNLYISTFESDSFYLLSYKNYEINQEEKSITIQFYKKPFFLVWFNQSDVIAIWLNETDVYKLYYKNSHWEKIFMTDVKYDKSMENRCTLVHNGAS